MLLWSAEHGSSNVFVVERNARGTVLDALELEDIRRRARLTAVRAIELSPRVHARDFWHARRAVFAAILFVDDDVFGFARRRAIRARKRLGDAFAAVLLAVTFAHH